MHKLVSTLNSNHLESETQNSYHHLDFDVQSENFERLRQLTSGYGLRVMIYSHDTFGLGHLQRCLKIANALISNFPKLSILLVTGSPVVDRFKLPPGVDYVKLPAVRKVGPEKYEARTLGTTYRRILNIRTNILLQTIQDYNPHLLLVDHSPLGMKSEMLPSLEWLKKSGSNCVKLLGLRDIIDSSENVCELWNKDGIYEVLDELYNFIMVYGSPSVYETTKEYKFSSQLNAKTYYCNYIVKNLPGNTPPRSLGKNSLVTVTIGGGDGAGEIIIGNYLQMLREQKNNLTFDSVILTGSFLEEHLVKRFRKEASGLPVTIKRFINNADSYFKKSDLVVSTAGYNTVTELLGCAKRALLIPRVMHRHEQLIRSTRLHDLNLVDMLHPDDVTAESLTKKIFSQLSSKSLPLVEAREKGQIQLNGTSNLAGFCGKLFLKESLAS